MPLSATERKEQRSHPLGEGRGEGSLMQTIVRVNRIHTIRSYQKMQNIQKGL
jgi:hypothetical protein